MGRGANDEVDPPDPSDGARSDPHGRHLNLKQVAALLDVHYMTAYRYVRQGRLAARMVDGGWVVTDSDLERFRHSADGLGDAGHQGHDQQVARMRHVLAEADEPEAWRCIEAMLAGGTAPQQVLSDVLPRALDPGSGDRDDAVARARSAVATTIASRLVDRLSATCVRPGRPRGTVLLAAPSGEQHRLPIATVGALVRLGGFRTIELGADVEPEVIAAAVGLRPLTAVGIGVTTAISVDAAARTVAAVALTHPDLPVIVGGQALRNDVVARLVGTEWWAADGQGMVALLDRIAAERTRHRRSTRAR